jgi:hypothetical protein
MRKYYGVHDKYGASSGQTRNISGAIGVWEDDELDEQVDQGEKNFQRQLKAKQKAILLFQINHYETKINDMRNQQAQAAQKGSEAIRKTIDGLRDQMRSIDAKPTSAKALAKQDKEKTNETFTLNEMLFNYIKDRGDIDLRESLKESQREILMESAMKKLFVDFDNGKTNEEIVLDYATKGINLPETIVKTARSHHEQYQKLKLELEMSEKAFKNEASKIVNNAEGNGAGMEMGEKKLSTSLTK